MWKEESNSLGGGMEGHTLVGRKVPMTSEVFWTSCGPPGGGGGTTRGPAIVRVFNRMWASVTFIATAGHPCSTIVESLAYEGLDHKS